MLLACSFDSEAPSKEQPGNPGSWGLSIRRCDASSASSPRTSLMKRSAASRVRSTSTASPSGCSRVVLSSRMTKTRTRCSMLPGSAKSRCITGASTGCDFEVVPVMHEHSEESPVSGATVRVCETGSGQDFQRAPLEGLYGIRTWRRWAAGTSRGFDSRRLHFSLNQAVPRCFGGERSHITHLAPPRAETRRAAQRPSRCRYRPSSESTYGRASGPP